MGFSRLIFSGYEPPISPASSLWECYPDIPFFISPRERPPKASSYFSLSYELCSDAEFKASNMPESFGFWT